MSYPREPSTTRSRATRDRVLDAASRVAERGLDQLGVAAIASEAGIGAGTLYQYFRGLDEVLEAVVRRHLDRFRELIVETFAAEEFADAAAASTAVADAFVEYYRTEPGFRALWFEHGLGSRFRSLEQANHDVLAATMADQLIAAGLMPDSGVARTVAAANWELVDAIVGRAFLRHPQGDPAMLTYLRHVVGVVATTPPLDVVLAIHRAGTLPSDG